MLGLAGESQEQKITQRATKAEMKEWIDLFVEGCRRLAVEREVDGGGG